MIRFESVSKSYDGGTTYAVRDVTLRARPRTTLVLLGESGCGKTTTLKMMNRLEEPSSGRIRIDGDDIMRFDAVGLRRQIGYVFQGIGLFPHLTVAENIATVPQLLGWSRADIDARVEELLELVGLPASRYAARYPEALSGGQQQRVGVARALAARPRYSVDGRTLRRAHDGGYGIGLRVHFLSNNTMSSRCTSTERPR